MPKKPRLWRRLIKILLGLVVLLVCTATVLIVLVVPTLVRGRINDALSKYWDGSVRIEEIQIGYAGGPSIVRGVTLYGSGGKQWAHIDSAKLIVKGWPGTAPVLKGIEIDKLLVTAHFTDGRCAPPFKRPFPTPKELKYVDLGTVNIRETSIEAASGAERRFIYQDLRFDGIRDERTWRVALKASSGRNGIFDLAGWVDTDTLRSGWTLAIRRSFDQQNEAETAALLAALDVPLLHRLWGTVSAELDYNIKLDDPNSWMCTGTASVTDGAVFVRRGPAFEQLDIKLQFKGRRVELTQLSAAGLGGRAGAFGYIQVEPNRVTCAGHVALRRIDLAELTRLLPQQSPVRSGQLDLNYTFAATGMNISDVTGRGQLFFDDSDMRKIGTLRGIFTFIGLADTERPGRSDVVAVFSTRGPVVTIQRGRLASMFTAIDVERGGQINLQTGQIDMYVIGTPFKTAGGILTHLPIPGMALVTILSQKLFRLHVKGHYSDPPGKLITKEPLKDLQDGTIDFLRYCATSGGQLTSGVLGPIGVFLKFLQPNPAQR